MSDEAIPAATLILVREREAKPPEFLMVERAHKMAFAAGAWVFPGGRIDPADLELGAASGTEAAVVAAIRETVEEAAIPVGLSPAPDQAQARELQDALVADRPFEGILRQNSISLDPAALTPFARWVPKFHAVRRFDTLFFLARCTSEECEPRVIEGECTRAAWFGAAELLEQDRRGEARLIFPTRRNLERLAQHSTFDEIRADALAHPVEPITPWVEQHEGEQFITIPAHLGYPVTREKLEGLWRG